MPYRFNPFTGSLDYYSSTSSSATDRYEATFSSVDLTSNRMVVYHYLKQKYFSSYMVFDNNDIPVGGHTLKAINEDAAILDLTGMAVTGTWTIVVRK